ncbi:MAG: hypothetical protein GY904_15730 [Planctomycetaceae bacterium]|nr:hypothetical protein [Planctomycetaceae bacterium]
MIILLAATIRVAGVVGNMYLVAHYHERTLIAIAIIAFVAFGFTIALPLPVAGRNQIGLAIVASCVCMAGSLLIHVRDLLKN